jgi:hypothetical protein
MVRTRKGCEEHRVDSENGADPGFVIEIPCTALPIDDNKCTNFERGNFTAAILHDIDDFV